MVSTLREGEGRQGGQGSERQDSAKPSRVKGAHIITEHIDVGVPSGRAFDQWTQYDKWSEIFKNESAKPNRASNRPSQARSSRSKGLVKIRSKIGPSAREWTAEIVESEPGRRIRWCSKGPLQASGSTSFHRLDDRLTQVMVEIEYHPSGFLEVVGNTLRMPRRRVRRDLKLFKHYVELGSPEGGSEKSRQSATGAARRNGGATTREES